MHVLEKLRLRINTNQLLQGLIKLEKLQIFCLRIALNKEKHTFVIPTLAFLVKRLSITLWALWWTTLIWWAAWLSKTFRVFLTWLSFRQSEPSSVDSLLLKCLSLWEPNLKLWLNQESGLERWIHLLFPQCLGKYSTKFLTVFSNLGAFYWSTDFQEFSVWSLQIQKH